VSVNLFSVHTVKKRQNNAKSNAFCKEYQGYVLLILLFLDILMFRVEVWTLRELREWEWLYVTVSRKQTS